MICKHFRLTRLFHFMVILALSIPAAGSVVHAQSSGEKKPATGFVETFADSGYRERWWFGNFDHGGDRFVTGWRRKMAGVEMPVLAKDAQGGELVLKFAPAQDGASKPFFGAEGQRGGAHHYGDYETVMQAGRGSGTISAFFTYTGPYFKDPHDEIDIEILGKDPTKIYLNLFVGGKQMPGKWLPLGFDSSTSFNLYRFEWREDRITWFVNGRQILQVTAAETAIPQTPGKLFVSLWGGAPWQSAWSGALAPATRTEARFACVSYRPLGDDGAMCSDVMAR